MDKNKKLEVKNLKISFRTINGKVQAVRDISFDLFAEDTLAIVGESGSGKSVTSKAILGILAGNAIVEGGEIIYDGKNLLSIPEEEFHKIRGDKIAMIFQDPLSSLNPIMRIGKQLTEAMLLKGKARQKESRIIFNRYLGLLKKYMTLAIANGDEELKKELTQKCDNFDKFEYKHLELENKYNVAYESAVEVNEDIEVLAFEVEKNALKDFAYRIRKIKKYALQTIHEHVVSDDKEMMIEECNKLIPLSKISKKELVNKEELLTCLRNIQSIAKKALAFTAPNYFTIAYYLTFNSEPLPDASIEEINSLTRKYLDDNFMLDFIEDTRKVLEYSANESYKKKAEIIEKCDKEYKEYFSAEKFDRIECSKVVNSIIKEVKDSIDKLETVKDSIAYTFDSSLDDAVDKYFNAINKNEKEQIRYNKQKAKYDKIIASGKTPEWNVVPLSLIDIDEAKNFILHQFDIIKEHYVELLNEKDKRDYNAEAINVIDYLKSNAQGVVAKITKNMAKAKAIKLMDEVGISEPRKRYNQYPFEFSGGMRQRIVIAIALAANPDILICDEPTTALDVTIQAQILELINDLKKKRKLAVIFITHDLGVVANMADRIAVMYAGKIVEYGSAYEIFYKPAHPYTWALLSSMPDLDTNEKLEAIPGTPPNMIYPPKGDAFAERNKYALKIDFEMQPPMFKISDTHYAATWLLHENAPKIDPPKIVTERIERMRKINEEKMHEYENVKGESKNE